jgi:hypothetical protein
MISLIINVIVMLLLVLTIVFCWRLNNKITELRSGRRELLELIKSLDNTILRTHTNINELKNMSQNSAVELNVLVSRAKENISDLNFINETAGKLADRLERNMSEARYLCEKLKSNYRLPETETEMSSTPANTDTPPIQAPNTAVRSSFSRAKQELMSVLKMVK